MSSTDPYSATERDSTDEDFTDIELAEQTAESPVSEAGGAAEVDQQLRDAHEQAAHLRAYADQLTQLGDAELSEHVDFYQRTHGDLQRALSDIDNA